jgi:ATP-dependent Clp protease adaptor protein ClpS
MESQTAIAEPTAAPAKPRQAPATRPKRQPPYGVIVLNDDKHTFPYVIEVLQKTFGYALPRAFKLTLQVHVSGRALVWSGPLETAEFKRDRIIGFGPDGYGAKPVTFPLGCMIEPMAE